MYSIQYELIVYLFDLLVSKLYCRWILQELPQGRTYWE